MKNVGPRPISALYDRFLRKPPKQSRSRSVVEAVLEAAVDLLPGKGDDDDAVALNDIATRAGVGVGSLYDYFADRSSILASLSAKVMEDNRLRLEAQLEASRSQPLEVAIGELVDAMIEMYLRDARIPRLVLRIAHRIGFMATMSESLTLFSRVLASALRERTDIRPANIDAAAYVVTTMAVGVLHAALWADPPPFTKTQLRDELVAACIAYLGRPSP